MATKKSTATAKKTTTKSAKKAAKKTTKKVAAKKTAKKAAKKGAKKVTKKVTKKVMSIEPELNLNTAKSAPSIEELQQAAYFNYIERIQSGTAGSPELDWAKAEQDLA